MLCYNKGQNGGINMIKSNTEWKDFSVIATGGGEKLERWGKYVLLRPDPQAIWNAPFDLSQYAGLSARYIRKGGGGEWEYINKMPNSWEVGWRELRFKVIPMGFKHTGLFPEQAVNWAKMIEIIRGAKREVSVLNLFAYTGGATVACLSAGAKVCHVDAAKGMVERAKENVELNRLGGGNIRYIVDDCMKFVERELRRGRHYDAVIMDPPSYGRGPSGEMWKLEDCLPDLLSLTKGVLSDNPLFFLINSYTTGLQSAVLQNMLNITFDGDRAESYEVALATEQKNVVLPCGCSGIYQF